MSVVRRESHRRPEKLRASFGFGRLNIGSCKLDATYIRACFKVFFGGWRMQFELNNVWRHGCHATVPVRMVSGFGALPLPLRAKSHRQLS